MCYRPAIAAALLFAFAASSAWAQEEYDVPSESMAQAIDSGSVAAVRRLLDDGVSPDTRVYGSPALQWAAWDGRYFVVRLLIERGADVNLKDSKDDYTPLMASCSVPNAKLVKLLLDKGADVNAVETMYGLSALQMACSSGNEALFDLLIARGADIRHTDKHGGNCLEEAAFYGAKEIVAKLRKEGLTSDWPLHIACGLGDVEQVKRLLADGAKANQANDGWKNTPMHFASGGGHVEIGKLLLENGAKLDSKNLLGATPLHASAGADTLAFTKWLVEQEVDINAKDEEGITPLTWAGQKTAKYLESKEAEYGDSNEKE